MIIETYRDSLSQLIFRKQSFITGDQMIWYTKNTYGDWLRIEFTRTKSKVFGKK